VTHKFGIELGSLGPKLNALPARKGKASNLGKGDTGALVAESGSTALLLEFSECLSEPVSSLCRSSMSVVVGDTDIV